MISPTSVCCVAEVGSTHDGDLDHMFALIGAAKGAGLNAVKWQWLSSAERLVERRRADGYLESYRLLEFPAAWLPQLRDAARSVGLGFLCTVYLPEDAETVAPHVDAIKVASFEAGATDVLRAVRATSVPMVVSTGMMNGYETLRLLGTWLQHDDTLLHCVSAYPCPPEALNLSVLKLFRPEAVRAGVRIGLSDHAAVLMPWTGALAVAAGAQMLEFHFRLETCPQNNRDYAVALPPDLAAEYVAHVRLAERILGSSEKMPHDIESAMARYRVRG